LLAFALAGCAVPHKTPAPAAKATTAPRAPLSAAPSGPEPVVPSAATAASANQAKPAPLGESVVLIAPLKGGDVITAADAETMAPVAQPGKPGKPLAKGMASWYGPGFHGRRTASGERYDMHALTAAHKTLPFGTKVRVRSVHTGKEVVVRINDRGPYKHQRIIDLSQAAMVALGLMGRGVTEVELLRE
jgi:rare lipoprotein A